MKITLTTETGTPLALSNLIVRKGMSIYEITDTIEDAIEAGLEPKVIEHLINDLKLDTKFEIQRVRNDSLRFRGRDLFGNVRYLIVRK